MQGRDEAILRMKQASCGMNLITKDQFKRVFSQISQMNSAQTDQLLEWLVLEVGAVLLLLY